RLRGSRQLAGHEHAGAVRTTGQPVLWQSPGALGEGPILPAPIPAGVGRGSGRAPAHAGSREGVTMKCAVVFLALSVARVASAQPAYDLLLKGGHVIDGRNEIDAVRDVAIKDGKIAAVATNIPS